LNGESQGLDMLVFFSSFLPFFLSSFPLFLPFFLSDISTMAYVVLPNNCVFQTLSHVPDSPPVAPIDIMFPFPKYSRDMHIPRYFAGGTMNDLLAFIYNFYDERIRIRDLVDAVTYALPWERVMLHEHCTALKGGKVLTRRDIDYDPPGAAKETVVLFQTGILEITPICEGTKSCSCAS